MTLNNKELRAIERALGMIVSTANVLGKGPNGTTLADAVQMIDNVLEAAEKLEGAPRTEPESDGR